MIIYIAFYFCIPFIRLRNFSNIDIIIVILILYFSSRLRFFVRLECNYMLHGILSNVGARDTIEEVKIGSIIHHSCANGFIDEIISVNLVAISCYFRTRKHRIFASHS